MAFGFTVDEGKTYLVRLEVRNRTTKAGVPVEATLSIGISVYLETVPMVLIPEQVTPYNFGPNQARNFPFDMTVPAGTSGQSGTIKAWVSGPDGVEIASVLEELIISGIHAMPPFPNEPPLPTPMTGMPTAGEIAAVKATVKYRLDHLWFDPCAAVHFTEEMNTAITLSMEPIEALQVRIQAESDRVGDACLTEAGYWELLAEMEALNTLWHKIAFFTVPGAPPPSLPAGLYVVTSPNGMVYDLQGQPTGKHVTDYMTEEMREAYFQYQCFYLGGLSGQISCNNMWYAVEGLSKTLASITEACYQQQLTITKVMAAR